MFKTGTFYSYKTNSSIRYFYPLKTQNVCLRCHINAKVGNTLGVIEVKSNIYNVIRKIELENSIETIDYEKIAKLSKNFILEKPLISG